MCNLMNQFGAGTAEFAILERLMTGERVCLETILRITGQPQRAINNIERRGFKIDCFREPHCVSYQLSEWRHDLEVAA